jgi:hypothetical protein
MNDTAKIMRAQAEQAKAAAQANATLGASTSQLTLGQVGLIDRFREQAATVGMSRSQLMAYQAAQLGVTEQTKDAIAAVKAHEDALKAATKAKEDERNATNMLGDALKLLAAGYAALKIGEYIKDSAMMAARYETLGIVMGVVGKTAGYTQVQMDAAADSIARQGITMLESRNSAVKLVQAHVDLSNASKLARIAQDAAVIGNINSSEAFERLVNGISRGNVLILRNIGINVNLQAAYSQMADSLGKTTKELTENERVQARLNAVIERGSDIAGTYEAAMGTAGKQILSMQRYVDDLKTKFGETFNEVLTVGVMALTSGLKDANGEVSELAKNNQLAEWGHELTGVFIWLANAVGNVYTAMEKIGTFAGHQSAKQAIDTDYRAKIKLDNKDRGFFDMGKSPNADRIAAERDAALAAEDARYEQEQAALSGNFNKMNKAYAEFSAARIAKQKADADARLKVDQDYATRAVALMVANADKSVEVQRAAQAKLVKEVYQGTPQFRDTEGREAKPKIDKADNTVLQDHLAQIEKESAAETRYTEYLMKLDDMRHKAGEMGDAEYYANRKDHLANIADVESQMYDKELAALRAHHNSTKEEEAKTAKAINDIIGKQAAAREKTQYENGISDEESRLRDRAAVLASDDAINKYTSDLQRQLTAIEIATGKRKTSKAAVEAETVAIYEQAVANMKLQASAPITEQHTEADRSAAVAMLADLEKELGLHQQIRAALVEQEAVIAQQRAADQAIADWQRAGSSIADSLSNAFGTGGKAIGQIFKAYSEGMAGQLKAQKDLAAAKKLADDNPEKIESIQRAQLAGAQAQVKSYGDMADAAQGFFEKGSRGYEAMASASKVMHAAEVALSVVKGVNAVLTQGEGDPYTAFARMAAMTALVAGLGVALSGGGGGVSAADRQKAQGTGSVLGDPSAKSNSIARSVELAAANSSTQINYLSGMLNALHNIESGIGSFASVLVRTTGVTGATAPDYKSFSGKGVALAGAVDWGVGGAMLGSMLLPGIGTLVGGILGAVLGHGFVGKALSSIFGGSQSVTDSGFTLGRSSLGSIMSNGAQGTQYTDIKTDGGWFHGDSHDTQTTGLGTDANAQLTTVIKSEAEGITEAAKLLGVCGDDFNKRLNGFVVDIGKISLKGLTGDEIQKQLEAAFSKLGDDMARFAVGGLDKFAKVGEGYLETLTRVATDYASVGAIFDSMGKSLDVANKPTAAFSGFIGGVMGKMVDGFVNHMKESLPTVSAMSIEARERLVDLAGGIDKMASQANGFAQNFLTKAEQLAPVTKYVNDQMAALGFTGITTRDQFKALVIGLDASTQKGAEQYTALMALQDAFAKTHAATVDLSKSEQEIADERKGLQDQLDQLTLTQVQLLAKQRNALDAANRPLFDMVQAAQKLAGTSSDMAKFRDAAKSLHDGLATGSLSTLTPEQQYAELRRQYEQTKAAALGGDTTAQGNVASALTAFLTFSQKINGADSQYASDFAMGQSDSAAMAQWASGQVDAAQAQLAAMNTANATLTAISQGIDQLNNAPINAANYGTSDNLAVLVAEVKSLNAKIDAQNKTIDGLRADANKNAGNGIVGHAQSQQDAADTIVDGLGGLITRVVNKAKQAALE